MRTHKLKIKAFGRLFFVAVHPFFTRKPDLRRWPIGWSLWWLWVEVAYLDLSPSKALAAQEDEHG